MSEKMQVPDASVDVMILEPDLTTRQRSRQIFGGHLAFGKCVLTSTLEEGDKRIKNGEKVDGFFVSSKFDLSLVAGFIQSNRSKLNRRAANMLVLSPGAAIAAQQLKSVKADGYLIEPKHSQDLDGAASFLNEYKAEFNPEARKRHVTDNTIRALCARLALAVDRAPTNDTLLRELGNIVTTLDDETKKKYFESLIEFFSEITPPK